MLKCLLTKIYHKCELQRIPMQVVWTLHHILCNADRFWLTFGEENVSSLLNLHNVASLCVHISVWVGPLLAQCVGFQFSPKPIGGTMLDNLLTFTLCWPNVHSLVGPPWPNAVSAIRTRAAVCNAYCRTLIKIQELISFTDLLFFRFVQRQIKNY